MLFDILLLRARRAGGLVGLSGPLVARRPRSEDSSGAFFKSPPFETAGGAPSAAVDVPALRLRVLADRRDSPACVPAREGAFFFFFFGVGFGFCQVFSPVERCFQNFRLCFELQSSCHSDSSDSASASASASRSTSFLLMLR